MKKYLVMNKSTATAENENFFGETHTYIFGKGCESVAAFGDEWIAKPLWATDIAEYGYNTPAQARRNYAYRNPENTKHWQTSVEVICFELNHLPLFHVFRTIEELDAAIESRCR